MKTYIFNKIEYELLKEYKEGFDKEETEKRLTEYFNDFDYVLGDWSYGKLRLKGFCNKENKLFKELNDFNMVDNYIKDNCAYDCKYYILTKI